MTTTTLHQPDGHRVGSLTPLLVAFVVAVVTAAVLALAPGSRVDVPPMGPGPVSSVEVLRAQGE